MDADVAQSGGQSGGAADIVSVGVAAAYLGLAVGHCTGHGTPVVGRHRCPDTKQQAKSTLSGSQATTTKRLVPSWTVVFWALGCCRCRVSIKTGCSGCQSSKGLGCRLTLCPPPCFVSCSHTLVQLQHAGAGLHYAIQRATFSTKVTQSGGGINAGEAVAQVGMVFGCGSCSKQMM